jgi:hypothetical protein
MPLSSAFPADSVRGQKIQPMRREVPDHNRRRPARPADAPLLVFLRDLVLIVAGFMGVVALLRAIVTLVAG